MFSPPDGDLQLLSTWLKPLSSLATYVAINRKKSASFLSSIQQKESHEEFVCNLTMSLASQALFVLDP
jgi:hypothetical protein